MITLTLEVCSLKCVIFAEANQILNSRMFHLIDNMLTLNINSVLNVSNLFKYLYCAKQFIFVHIKRPPLFEADLLLLLHHPVCTNVLVPRTASFAF